MSDNVFINALASRSWIEEGAGADIAYAFSDSYLAWSDAEKSAVRAALSQISAVANITFHETAESAATLVEHRVTNEQLAAAIAADYFDGVKGWHYAPSDVAGTDDAARGYFDYSGLSANHAQWLTLHEMLHAVGLEHPHSDWHGSGLFPGVTVSSDPGAYGLNSNLTTVMSYRAYNNFAGTTDGPMAFDIAALQALYGAKEQNGGADTYDVGRDGLACIWDSGGVDWFVANGSAAATIDLRAATLDVSALGGGVLSFSAGRSGGLTIAHGVIIENARGGAGANTITGNEFSNTLLGGGSNDVLRGGGGNDRLNGQSGADTLVGQGGADTFVFIARTDSLPGTRDRIVDFGTDDLIDLAALDANTVLSGNNAFAWSPSSTFSGRAGELHAVVTAANTYLVEADVNGDKVSDFAIVVQTAALGRDDFIL